MMEVRKLLLPALALLPLSAAAAQHEPHAGGPPSRLGTVHFETSCSAAVRADFGRAVALLHSFWFSAAIDGFSDVLRKDPGCAIAYWGIAMSQWGNPFAGAAGRSTSQLQQGRASVEKAKAAAAKTQRERDYIGAVELLYLDFETKDNRTRTLAYEKAMAGLAATHADDPEARIFYALSLDQTWLPSDKTYANLLKAAEILERELERQPDHPGITHYIIHSYDVPALAERALEAARRYAKIAPDAPHALHMPSHTFTRVGSWQESIETNIASAAAARKDGSTAEELHAYDYQVYAYLQSGQDQAAQRVLEQLEAARARLDIAAAGGGAPGAAGVFALAAIPARYALERGAWKDAAALAPRPSRFAWADSLTHFARALGSARSGDPVSARKDIATLAGLRDALLKANDAFWAEQAEIQRKAAEAWTLAAEGKPAEALALMRAAADQEDGTEKSAITPGPLAPARELLGEMLLELGQPAEASIEFEKTMKKEPNRLRGLSGAARAAELAGERAKAERYYARFLEICSNADRPGRPELAYARDFVSGKKP